MRFTSLKFAIFLGQFVFACGTAIAADDSFADFKVSYTDLAPITFDANSVTSLATEIAIGTDYVINPAASTSFDDAIHYQLRRIETPDLGPYGFGTFFDQTRSVGLDFIAALAFTSYTGFSDWDWGTSSFHFTNEGWFGANTYAGGMDKLGHVYSTYVFSEYFTQQIAHRNDNIVGAAVTGAILGMAVQTGVEIFDGFSTFGFSKEDLIADGIGAGFSVLRSTVPGLDKKLDYRIESMKSGSFGFIPADDYSGQKYLLALKLSGFEQFEDSPLRFVELHAGYFARGFTQAEIDAGDVKLNNIIEA